MDASAEVFFRCESVEVMPSAASFDEPVNFRKVEYEFAIHETDVDGNDHIDVMDEAVLLTWKNFNSITGSKYKIDPASSFALEEDKFYHIHIYFKGFVIEKVYYGHIDLFLSGKPGKKAMLEKFKKGLKIYHGDSFWLYPQV
jgi:hypothetical protein